MNVARIADVRDAVTPARKGEKCIGSFWANHRLSGMVNAKTARSGF